MAVRGFAAKRPISATEQKKGSIFSVTAFDL
jgi:hypothetical protein